MSESFTLVRPQGRLDAASAPLLDQELQQHLADGHTQILIDLSGTRYINSNGLRVLLRASQAIRRQGGRMKICCLGARLADIFSMAGFDQLFEIYETRAQAEQAFKNG
jgi:anti-anti-sigma factor